MTECSDSNKKIIKALFCIRAILISDLTWIGACKRSNFIEKLKSDRKYVINVMIMNEPGMRDRRWTNIIINRLLDEKTEESLDLASRLMAWLNQAPTARKS